MRNKAAVNVFSAKIRAACSRAYGIEKKDLQEIYKGRSFKDTLTHYIDALSTLRRHVVTKLPI